MPVLWAYARDLFTTPGFGDTINFEQIKRHYYVVHTQINPTQLVPKGPDLANWHEPHHRYLLRRHPLSEPVEAGEHSIVLLFLALLSAG